MLKVFFGAMGIGALIFSIMSMMGIQKLNNVRQLWKPTSLTRGWLTGPGLGGVLLGVGMALSGACPGMVWAAYGAKTELSYLTIVGGVIGAFVYASFAEKIQLNILNRPPLGPCSQVYADEAMGHNSPALLMMILGIVCLGGCAVLESLVPWKSELPSRLAEAMNAPACDFGSSTFSFIECPAWPPSIAGMLLGSLQFLGVMFIGNVLGSATSFQIISSLCTPSKLSTGYSKVFATPNVLSWFQLPYVALATLAAFVCANGANDVGRSEGVNSPLLAFIGGFILIFGSRLGGGCTSGHGLSGCAMLMIQSWIAVPAMFMGGIITAVVLQTTGNGSFFRID